MNTNEIKKFNIDVYFKVIVRKAKSKKKTIYVRMSGETDLGYTQEMRTYFENKIRNELKEDGYTVLAIMPCSEKEAATGSDDEIAPLGYMKYYLYIEGISNGEKSASAIACQTEFTKYFDETTWKNIAENVKRIFEEKFNMQQVTVSPTIKAIYELVAPGEEEISVSL